MFFRRKRSDLEKKIRESLQDTEVDYSSLFSNINNRAKIEPLYKELCSKAHPDRFVGNADKQEKALEIFKEIQASRNDLNQLLILKDKINTLIES